MSTPKEGPNPLRPYYIPPSVGGSAGTPSASQPPPNLGGKYGSSSQPATSSPSFGSSARNILADMDYSDYLSDSSPSSTATIKALAEQALWKYTSVFLAQPFDLAKTLLQVRAPGTAPPARLRKFQAIQVAPEPQIKRAGYRYSSEDNSTSPEPTHFTRPKPTGPTAPRRPRPLRRPTSPYSEHSSDEDRPFPRSRPCPHMLDFKSESSLIAAVFALWNKEGAWGIFKGTNSTYVYSILLSTITSFTRSFFAAIFAVPDPSLSFQISPPAGTVGGLDILSSPTPMASLAIAVSAAGIAGILVAPLDIARTKLMLTPSDHPPRSVMSTLNTLSSWTLPWSIAPVTFLHSTLPTFISASLPLFLRSKLSIDPVLTPTVYAFAIFVGQGLELGAKLPIETVLRRGQMDIAQTSTQSSTRAQELQTVVFPGPYKGLIGTMRSIVYEEGERIIKAAPVKSDTTPVVGGSAKRMTSRMRDRTTSRTRSLARDPERKKGQGFEGLWRGWRVGMWGLIGVWGSLTLGGAGSKGGEF
ncbi:MAG: hypothetical protein Q9221_007833 [Calogaya cf. arnoldii]